MLPSKNSREIVKLSVLHPDRKPNLGERIGVYWKCDKRFYMGEISSIDEKGLVTVNYDDGEKEILDLDLEIWEFESDPMRYKTPSRNDSESNPSSDIKNNDRNAGGKGDGEPEENDNSERYTSQGQSSASHQKENKYKRRIPLMTRKIQKTRNTSAWLRAQRIRKFSALFRAQRTRRIPRLPEVEDRGTRGDLENVEDVEDVEDVENEQERESS